MTLADPAARTGFDYTAHDGLGLADLIRRGEVTAREVLEAAIRRVEALNPALNAVVHKMYDRARMELAALPADAPFAGVPFLVKDLLTDIAGEPMTAGSRYLRDYVPSQDSEVARRYRRAGFAILGKTNTPELGLVQVTESRLFGPARNPWNPDRSTGGSSGGAAAAVAARMVPVAGGGDGGGSLRVPAACCGVFALKPSRGRVPAGPLFGEIWRGYVTEGVISRSVRDSAAALDALAGPDLGAPYVAPPPARPFLDEIGARPGRLRIAVASEPPIPVPLHAEARRAAEAAAALCRDLGHEVVEAAPGIDGMQFHRDYVTVVAACTAAELKMAAERVGRPPRRGELEPRTRMLDLMGRSIDAATYEAAALRLSQAARRVAAFHERFDLLLTPAVAQPPLPHGELTPRGFEAVAQRIVLALDTGRVFRLQSVLDKLILDGLRFTPHINIQNVSGQPSMAVPLHWTDDGLPLGVQFAARYGEEATLFRLAAQLEQAAPWADRRPPVRIG